jgi:hypothetical protein
VILIATTMEEVLDCEQGHGRSCIPTQYDSIENKCIQLHTKSAIVSGGASP